MNVLIVESQRHLANLWAVPLQAQHHNVTVAQGQREAVAHLTRYATDIIILDLNLEEGSAVAVADFANYRQPKAKVVAVTRDRYFSDGSIFGHLSNVQTMVPAATPPRDLSVMVEHYAAAS